MHFVIAFIHVFSGETTKVSKIDCLGNETGLDILNECPSSGIAYSADSLTSSDFF